MLFNSIPFIYLFLPIAIISFTLAHRFFGAIHAQIVILIASAFFYAYWSFPYLVLLVAGIFFNFWLGKMLSESQSKLLLLAGITVNLAVLAYFKYANFFISNLDSVFQTSVPTLHIILPIGISFFIFQKIAYLVDCYQGQVNDHNLLRFALFVLFFPQLIAGPIVHHAEVTPQLRKSSLLPSPEYISTGLFLFFIGLFKKVVVADSIASYVDAPFAHASTLQFLEAWTAVVGYSLQIYFDFSAYSEMAMGLGLMFGIQLPINFNSPYKAANITEFWRRWHITLGRFLRQYLYIPLGGNRHGHFRSSVAAIMVMFLGGLWHGAGWTFVLWGLLHGLFLAIHKTWSRYRQLPHNAGVALTFFVVLFSWVLFRANSVTDAISIWKTMLGMHGIGVPYILPGNLSSYLVYHHSPYINGLEILAMSILLLYVLTKKNVHELIKEIPSKKTFALASTAILFSLVIVSRPSTFLYFQF